MEGEPIHGGDGSLGCQVTSTSPKPLVRYVLLSRKIVKPCNPFVQLDYFEYNTSVKILLRVENACLWALVWTGGDRNYRTRMRLKKHGQT
ncbi:hypothetical protein PVAP13_4KG297105 [Panicum virgatum]|uniref:Uncharacterized protein n=1 Tax=Panicum virgatum TaxID=38727 RepID=A0A8T0TTQ3_PANVG|nr:hypothetical protein PVAP13_4KG297105 [Panicum virgatum]